jgi:hypothetical protein
MALDGQLALAAAPPGGRTSATTSRRKIALGQRAHNCCSKMRKNAHEPRARRDRGRGLIVVLRAAAKDEHSRQLHTALEKYDQIKILPKGEARSGQMKDFGLSLKSVCEQRLATLESAAACFTAGNALLEGRDFKLAAEFFGRAHRATTRLVSIAKFR